MLNLHPWVPEIYRAGTTTRFYWGDDPSLTTVNQYAWHVDNSGRESHAVGEKLPNPWGLYDMGGNVFENCQDRYGPYPMGSVTDPEGPSTGDQRVQRGGAWEHDPSYCRAAERSFNAPALSTSYDGFRLLRTDAETNVAFRALQKTWNVIALSDGAEVFFPNGFRLLRTNRETNVVFRALTHAWHSMLGGP